MTSDLRSILYAAITEPLGLLLRADPPSAVASMRQKLYHARTLACDPALSCLQIRIAPAGLAPGNLVLTRSTTPEETPFGPEHFQGPSDPDLPDLGF